jgi:hypothetical protein
LLLVSSFLSFVSISNYVIVYLFLNFNL